MSTGGLRESLRVTADLASSENSLNQHLKLKHMELWEKLKQENNANASGSEHHSEQGE